MSTNQETNKTVLVVEDDLNAREVYALVLQMEGYTVVSADNGSHALRLMEEHTVDAVVTDLLMPVMDGLDFATTVKSNPHHAKLPIILLSARDLQEEFKDIHVFSALLRKPCSAEDLTSTLSKALTKHAAP